MTIDDVNFDDMGGVEIDINSASADASNSNNTLQETISITDVNSQNGNSRGIWLRNTHASRTATITNYTNGTAGTAGSGGGLAGSGVLVFEGSSTNEFDGNVLLTNIDIFNNIGYALDYANVDTTSATTVTAGNGITWDGGAGVAGGMRFNNFNGTIGVNASTFTGGTLEGVRIIGASDGTFTFANTATFTNVGGTTIDIDGNGWRRAESVYWRGHLRRRHHQRRRPQSFRFRASAARERPSRSAATSLKPTTASAFWSTTIPAARSSSRATSRKRT